MSGLRFVYFAKSSTLGEYRVGVTADVKTRLEMLQTRTNKTWRAILLVIVPSISPVSARRFAAAWNAVPKPMASMLARGVTLARQNGLRVIRDKAFMEKLRDRVLQTELQRVAWATKSTIGTPVHHNVEKSVERERVPEKTVPPRLL